jgi:iron complex outermembrane recepter protein
MLKKSRIGAAAALVAACASSVFAQDTQRIEIVGSNIKRVASEGALPVTIITREQIERSGASSVAELLQNIGAAGQRGFETQASSSFTPGAAAVGLRGLSAGDTLVLFNGRRMAPFANASQSTADGAIAFVDLNSLPVSAVESIQVLKDGASAVYGADAVAGVINVITRKDYRGLEVGTRFGVYEEKGGNEAKAYVTTGFGDFAKDRFNVLASLEVAKTDAIFFRDRRFFTTFDHRAKAPFMGDQRSAFSDHGNYAVVDGDGAFRRGNNCPLDRRRGIACRYDFGPVEQLAPDIGRVAGLLVGNVALGANTSGFFELALNRNTVDVEGRAPAMDTSTDFFQVDVARNLALGTTRDALRAALAQQVPAGLLTVPGGALLDVRTRFTDFGPRDDTTKSTTKRLLAGLRGNFGNWDWEAAVSHSGGESTTVNRNEMRKDLLADLIVSG